MERDIAQGDGDIARTFIIKGGTGTLAGVAREDVVAVGCGGRHALPADGDKAGIRGSGSAIAIEGNQYALRTRGGRSGCLASGGGSLGDGESAKVTHLHAHGIARRGVVVATISAY